MGNILKIPMLHLIGRFCVLFNASPETNSMFRYYTFYFIKSVKIVNLFISSWQNYKLMLTFRCQAFWGRLGLLSFCSLKPTIHFLVVFNVRHLSKQDHFVFFLTLKWAQ
jgi:hypothetical protein